MEPEKAALLYGDVPSWADPDDPDDRSTLLAQRGLSQDRRRHGSRWNTILELVAAQIVGDDPRQVWRTADRLLADGMDREQVLGQLVLALSMSEPALWEDLDLARGGYAGFRPGRCSRCGWTGTADAPSARRRLAGSGIGTRTAGRGRRTRKSLRY